MPKKRGMLKAEKVAAIMEVLHGNHKEGFMMFNERDLKRICSKEKGVTEQSVMEVLKEEMDGMYDCDMLGSSKIYWSLKSAESHKRKSRRESVDAEFKKISVDVDSLKKRKLEAEHAAAGGLSERARQDLDKKKMSLLKQKEHLAAALSSCVDSDYYSSLQQVSTTAFDAANRWTDNLFNSRSYMESKLNVEKSDVNKMLSEFIKNPADLDYLPE